MLENQEQTIPAFQEKKLDRDAFIAQKIDRAIRQSPNSAGISTSEMTILDIGTGKQLIAENLKKMGYSNVLTLDVVVFPEVLKKEDRLPIVKAEGQAIPFQDEAVDWVVTCLTLHHIPEMNSVKVIQEALRVAKKGVVFVENDNSGWFGLRKAITKVADQFEGKAYGYKPVQQLKDQAQWQSHFEKAIQDSDFKARVTLPEPAINPVETWIQDAGINKLFVLRLDKT